MNGPYRGGLDPSVRILLIVLGALAAGGVLFLLARSAGVGDDTATATTASTTTTTADVPDMYGAFDVCRQKVRDQLRSPGSAKFGALGEANAIAEGAAGFRVTGYVDSQNGFGAVLRSDWVCQANYDGAGQWTVAADITPR